MMRALFSLLVVVLAADWPQWRGPNRDGLAAGMAPRASWPRALAPAWKVTVGGGHSSPIVAGSSVFLHTREGDDEVVSRFDLPTGRRVWRQAYAAPYTMNPAASPHGKGPKSTPVAQGGRLFTLEEGELLWKVPLQTDYEQNAVTPVIHGQDVIYSGLGKGIHAVRIAKRGGAWVAEKQWENPDLSMYMSSPVLDGDRLYGFSHRQKGQAFCLDARTGKTLWAGPGRQGENAALIRGGNELFVVTTDAQLSVAPADAGGFALSPRTPSRRARPGLIR